MGLTPPGQCPICGSSEYRVVYDMTAPGASGSIPGLIARCQGCPMWFKAAIPPGAIEGAYGDEYGEDVADLGYMSSDTTRAFFRKSLQRVAAAGGRPPRLLDIGSGTGALLEVAGAMGFDAEGIDLCRPNVERAAARGLRVRHGDAAALDVEGEFDVVTMMDIIEHVVDPVGLLRTVGRALAPGGRLVVYTPNHRAAIVLVARMLARAGVVHPVQEIFGRNHVCFFDDRTLALGLERAGLSLEAMKLAPYDPRRPGAPISLVSLAGVTLIERLGQPFRRTFRMLAYARRPTGNA